MPCPSISQLSLLDSWTHSHSPVFLSSHSIPQPGAKTQNLNRGHAPSTPTVHPCPVWLPSVLSPENWTGFVYTVQGSPPPGSPQSPSPTHACFVHDLTHFSVVSPASLAAFAKEGLRGGGASQGPLPPCQIPLTIPHAGSLKPAVFAQVLIFFVMVSLYPLSLCLASPDPQFLNHFKASK